MSRRAAIVFLLSALLFILASGASAEDGPGEPLREGDALAAVARMRKAQSGFDSVVARVTQTKSSPLLEKDAVTEGTVLIKRPNLMRWEVTSPQRMVVVVDGAAMWLYRPAKREAVKRLLARDPVARYTAGFLSSSMDFRLEELSKAFTYSVFQKDGDLTVRLEPRSKVVSRFVRSLSICYGGDGLPRWFELRTQDASIRTVVEEAVVNGVKDDSAFRLKLPPGTAVRTLDAEEGR